MFCNGNRARRPSSSIMINNNQIEFVDSFKYLGFTLTFNRKDNCHIGNLYRGLCARANMVLRNFSKCTNEVKTQLFKSYCTSFYGLSLSVNITASQFNNLKVCYNKGIRKLFKLQRQDSISEICVNKGLPTLKEIRRRGVVSLLQRLKEFNNSIAKSLTNMTYFQTTYLFKEWKLIAYVQN